MMHSPSSQPKLRANDDGEIRVGSPIPVSLNRRLKANAVQVDAHKRSLPKSKAFGDEKKAKKQKTGKARQQGEGDSSEAVYHHDEADVEPVGLGGGHMGFILTTPTKSERWFSDTDEEEEEARRIENKRDLDTGMPMYFGRIKRGESPIV